MTKILNGINWFSYTIACIWSNKEDIRWEMRRESWSFFQLSYSGQIRMIVDESWIDYTGQTPTTRILVKPALGLNFEPNTTLPNMSVDSTFFVQRWGKVLATTKLEKEVITWRIPLILKFVLNTLTHKFLSIFKYLP